MFVSRTLGIASLLLSVGMAAAPLPIHAQTKRSAGFGTSRPSPLPASSADLDRLFARANSLQAREQRADASSLYQQALAAAESRGAGAQVARALCGLARAAAEPAEARQYGLRCLARYQALGDLAGTGRAHRALADVARRLKEPAEERRHMEQAVAAFVAAGDRRAHARAQLWFIDQFTRGSAEKAQWAEQMIQTARASRDRFLEAMILHAWADDSFAVSVYPGVLERLQRAASLYKAIGAHDELGTVYNSLGRLYRTHGMVDDALAYQRKALALHRRYGTTFSHVQSLNAVASTHLNRNELPEARRYYLDALARARKSGTKRMEDFLLGNLASAYMAQGRFADAIPIFEGVLARGADLYPSHRSTRLSKCYLKVGRLAEALTAADRAVETCGTFRDMCANAYSVRSAVQATLGHDEAAQADVRQALDIIERFRHEVVPQDRFKQNFAQANHAIYTHAIELDLQRDRPGDALETAELARSRAFLDLLASRAGAEHGAASSTPRDGDALAAPATAAELTGIAARLRSTLVIYWVTDDELFVWVASPDGAIVARRVEVLQSRLARLVHATTPLVFAPASSVRTTSTQAAIVTRGAARVVLDDAPVTAWRELHDLLIQPIRDLLPKKKDALLTIVPHGPLVKLSFAALRDARGRYLLEDFTLHYAPAGGVLRFTADKRRTTARDSDVLILADPAVPPLPSIERHLPRLPGARAERLRIARQMSAASITTLEGDDATESRVRAAVGDKGVLHFATHAIIDDDDPLASYLVVGADARPQDSDGLLTAKEIYGLDLHAHLVVLSACRSGGATISGDGVSTFARAFMYAGVPSLVVSLWDVADVPTSRLLPEFYRAWRGGAAKAASLRSAQLRLIRDLRAGRVEVATPVGPVALPDHPVFWAGFVLVGEPE
jgi:CHAT domain-containing protein/tetratricopeptide (TPR) repeat protein